MQKNIAAICVVFFFCACAGSNARLPGSVRTAAAAADRTLNGWEVWLGLGNEYGSFDITDGKLRYFLTDRQHDAALADPAGKDGYYPGLLLAKPLTGKKWTVVLKAAYTLPYGSGRWFSGCVWIGKDGVRPSLLNENETLGLCYYMRADQSGYGEDSVAMEVHHQHGAALAERKVIRQEAGYYRFQRNGDSFKFGISQNGQDYTEILDFKTTERLDDMAQKLVLGGQAAGSASGAVAEYDYIAINGKRKTF